MLIKINRQIHRKQRILRITILFILFKCTRAVGARLLFFFPLCSPLWNFSSRFYMVKIPCVNNRIKLCKKSGLSVSILVSLRWENIPRWQSNAFKKLFHFVQIKLFSICLDISNCQPPLERVLFFAVLGTRALVFTNQNKDFLFISWLSLTFLGCSLWFLKWGTF